MSALLDALVGRFRGDGVNRDYCACPGTGVSSHGGALADSTISPAICPYLSIKRSPWQAVRHKSNPTPDGRGGKSRRRLNGSLGPRPLRHRRGKTWALRAGLCFWVPQEGWLTHITMPREAIANLAGGAGTCQAILQKLTRSFFGQRSDGMPALTRLWGRRLGASMPRSRLFGLAGWPHRDEPRGNRSTSQSIRTVGTAACRTGIPGWHRSSGKSRGG